MKKLKHNLYNLHQKTHKIEVNLKKGMVTNKSELTLLSINQCHQILEETIY